MRTQAQRIMLLALVRHPHLQKVLREHIALQQERVVLLQMVQSGLYPKLLGTGGTFFQFLRRQFIDVLVQRFACGSILLITPSDPAINNASYKLMIRVIAAGSSGRYSMRLAFQDFSALNVGIRITALRFRSESSQVQRGLMAPAPIACSCWWWVCHNAHRALACFKMPPDVAKRHLAQTGIFLTRKQLVCLCSTSSGGVVHPGTIILNNGFGHERGRFPVLLGDVLDG